LNEIRKRKEEDIELILKEGVQSRATTLLECVKLIHNASG